MKSVSESIHFSRRELQCLGLSIRGKSASKVAVDLGISQRTVEEYLNNVKKKLGVTSKSEMIDIAISLILETQDRDGIS